MKRKLKYVCFITITCILFNWYLADTKTNVDTIEVKKEITGQELIDVKKKYNLSNREDIAFYYKHSEVKESTKTLVPFIYDKKIVSKTKPIIVHTVIE